MRKICPACLGDRDSVEARQQMVDTAGMFNLGFYFNPTGGGEYFSNEFNFRCQIGTDCNECDAKELRLAFIERLDIVGKMIDRLPPSVNKVEQVSSPRDPKIELLRDNLLKLDPSKRLEYFKANGAK
jgi:hypothetical protein